MRFLLRRIASAMRVVSLFPMGNPRVLLLRRITIWHLAKAILLTLFSSITLSLIGIGLHDVLTLHEVISSNYSYLWGLIIGCSAWIAMVSINHLHDIAHLIAQFHSWYDFLYLGPVAVFVMLVGPFYDLLVYLIYLPLGQNLISYHDLVVVQEITSFFMDSIPAIIGTFLGWTTGVGIRLFNITYDSLSPFVTLSVTYITGWGAQLLDWAHIGTANAINDRLPDWISQTRIGTWISTTLASGIITSLIVSLILKTIFWWW